MINTNDLKSLSLDEAEIDPSSVSDMEYWKTLWGVTAEQITAAIKQKGSNKVKTIEEYLM